MPRYGGAVVVAHRGYSAVAPENTLAAFRAAIEAGAPAAECDVYCTSDGHVVLLHDNTVDRTTDGTGPITGMTLEQVKQLDAGSWKGEQYKGEPVPTLAETLELVKGRCSLWWRSSRPHRAPGCGDHPSGRDAGDVTIIVQRGDVPQVRKLEPRPPVGWLASGVMTPGLSLMASTGGGCAMTDIIAGGEPGASGGPTSRASRCGSDGG